MLSESTLRLLNSTALTAMSNVITTNIGRINRRVSNARARLVRLTGQHQQYNSNGNPRLYSSPNSGNKGADKVSNKISTLKSSIDTMSILLNSGYDVFTTGQPIGDIAQMIQQARNELYTQFPQPIIQSKAYANNKVRRIYNGYIRIRQELFDLNHQMELIFQILKDRAEGVTEEPRLNYSALLSSGQLSEQQLALVSQYEALVENSVVKPFRHNKVYRESLVAQLKGGATKEEKPPRFDLVYGPPISTDGKFILSQDGLYYDSRNGGIPLTGDMVFSSRTWKLGAHPWEGGRGQEITSDKLRLISNTIFSDDFEADDPEGNVARLLEIDEVLQAYLRDRNIHHAQIEAYIVELVSTGFQSDSPTVINYRRSQAAHSDAYESKIKKRKKQLQLFGLFGGIQITNFESPIGQDVILKTLTNAEKKHLLVSNGYKIDGSDFPYNPGTDNIKRIGDIVVDYDHELNKIRVRKRLDRAPLNDFSYLKGSGVIPDLKVQKAIVIAEDVENIVVPQEPIFIKGNPLLDTVYLKDFSVDEISTGDFVKNQGGVSGTEPMYKSLGDSIITDGLVVCYNFLKPDITEPQYSKYELDNWAEGSKALNGKFVASSTAYAFPSGLSIPFLRGTIYDAETQYGIYYKPIDLQDVHNNRGGCYVRLPNNIKNGNLFPEGERVNGLTYGTEGWSMDFWTHIPEVSAGLTGHHRYRIVAACENSGNNPEPGSFITAVVNPDDDGPTKGLMIGFRDKDVSGTTTLTASSGGELEFVILPTLGQNSLIGAQDGWEWRHSIVIQEKDAKDATNSTILVNPARQGNATSGTELGIQIPVTKQTTSGKSCSSCDTEFSHYNVSFNYKQDTVSVFLDGELLDTSSISTAFSTQENTPLNVPSPIQSRIGSLQSWVQSGKYTENIAEGYERRGLPRYPIFTPWILGGGFSDVIGTSQNRPGATTPLGFLGANTNDQYKVHTGRDLSTDLFGGFYGQHIPSLGGQLNTGSTRKIPRSGLDGFLGSFKMYSKPLDSKEVNTNFNAQKGFFKNIATYRS
tara:strand:- start:4790 stop:7888 length:3099 start_codon:yes stop_codon:yes gene_type:complete